VKQREQSNLTLDKRQKIHFPKWLTHVTIDKQTAEEARPFTGVLPFLFLDCIDFEGVQIHSKSPTEYLFETKPVATVQSHTY
jgi:hypothetical protein